MGEDAFGEKIAKARYYEEDFIVGQVDLDSVRRKRTMAPLLRDEDIDLTINELMRIRGRLPQKVEGKRRKVKDK